MNDNMPPIKIRRLTIHNYKGIDELELEFPPPRMPDDPDILVMGSRNGLGKTSIIECCSLLLLVLSLREDRLKLRDRISTIDVPDLLIKAGAHFAEITGDLVRDNISITATLRLDRNGILKVSGESLPKRAKDNECYEPDRETLDFMRAICGFTPNPVIEKSFMLFHSYRKVQEGNPEMGMLVDRGRRPWRPSFESRYEFPMSAFKLQILHSLMGRANLFELVNDQESDQIIDKLNELMLFYAGGSIGKLRPSQDNTVDFRVTPIRKSESFTFDGLSSGQKEIISTLFLIWYHTRKTQSVVLIDEPELHLNAQWHRSFVNKLMSLAPQNQYIVATHSEDIMDSVKEDRRILLTSTEESTI